MYMKEQINILILGFAACSVINAQQRSNNLTGPYLGQKLPGMTPEIFAPGIISTEKHEFSCCFSPDGKEFYFTHMNPEERQNYVMYTQLINGMWTEPEMASFAGPFTFEPVELKLVMDAGQPFVSHDGKYLFFTSGDPKTGSDIYWVSAKIIEDLKPEK